MRENFTCIHMILTAWLVEEMARLLENKLPSIMMVDPEPKKSNEPPNPGSTLELSSTNPLIRTRLINVRVNPAVSLTKCLVSPCPSRMQVPVGPAQLRVILVVNTISSSKSTIPGHKRTCPSGLELIYMPRSTFSFALTHDPCMLLWIGANDCVNERTSSR